MFKILAIILLLICTFGQQAVDILGTVSERSSTYAAALRSVLTDLTIMKKQPLTRVLRILQRKKNFDNIDYEIGVQTPKFNLNYFVSVTGKNSIIKYVGKYPS